MGRSGGGPCCHLPAGAMGKEHLSERVFSAVEGWLGDPVPQGRVTAVLQAELCDISVNESSRRPCSLPQHHFLQQPPVPGMDDSMSYQAPPQQLPAAQPPQPSNPSHGAHALNSGPQPGTTPATQHSQVGPTSGQAYGQHTYTEPAKPKKGQQLWNRMKRKWAAQRSQGEGWAAASAGSTGCRDCPRASGWLPGAGPAIPRGLG